MKKVNTIELKKAMLDRDIVSVKELAALTGIGRDTLSKVLNGKTLPSSKVMYSLVNCLQLTKEQAASIFFAN